jgi:PAS domain S-box-containing protein
MPSSARRSKGGSSPGTPAPNACSVYSAEEAIGQSIRLIIPPERASEEDAILARIRAGSRIGHFETERIAKGGRRVDVSLTISPIHDERGRVVGASKVARDITLEKRAREAQREADRTKDEFLAILAHELRNRLAPIRNAVEVLERVGSLAPAAQTAVTMIERQTLQMIRLVNDLLDVSRISAQRARAAPEAREAPGRAARRVSRSAGR